jgi:hypothetical protein
MHTADLFAARFENERWLKEMSAEKSTRNPNGRPATKAKLGDVMSNTLSGGFDSTNVFDAFKDLIED